MANKSKIAPPVVQDPNQLKDLLITYDNGKTGRLMANKPYKECVENMNDWINNGTDEFRTAKYEIVEPTYYW